MAEIFKNSQGQDVYLKNGVEVSVSTGQPLSTAPITSETFQTTPTIEPQTPKDTPVYPVAGLDSLSAPLEMTQPEQQAQDLTSRLQSLNEALIGESAFRAEQEQAQGVNELVKTQNDLSGRLKALKNEALAIPIQLQQDVTGRGVTAGGLRPIETAALRNNAIQALGVSSLLEASRGNLTLALDLVDRAVAQKYDPLKEEIAVKQA